MWWSPMHQSWSQQLYAVFLGINFDNQIFVHQLASFDGLLRTVALYLYVIPDCLQYCACDKRPKQELGSGWDY
jgi:hypothetical protein